MATPPSLMRLSLVISLCIFGIQTSKGQFVPGMGSDKIEVTPNTAPKRTIIKASLLSPVELQNTVRLSVELSLNEHWSLQPEVGYIFDYASGKSRDKIASGYLNSDQKLSFRYYIPEKFVNGLYVGPQISYANFNFKRGLWRNLDPNLSDSAWFLDYSNPGEYHESDYGVYAIVGIQPALSRHFTLDLTGGFGMAMQVLTTKFDPSLKSGETLPPAFYRYRPEGLFAIHLGYVF